MKNCIKIAAIISISLLVFSSCAEMAKLDQKLKQGSVDKVSRMNNFLDSILLCLIFLNI